MRIRHHHQKFAEACKLLACAAACSSALVAADARAGDFAAKDAVGTLTVELVYESAGSRKNVGMMDTLDWRVTRTANIVSTLAAQPVTALPTVKAPDAKQVAAQNAYNKNAQDKTKSAVGKMAPMMDSIEKIMAKCGEDEACISSATANMGFNMSDSQKAANMSAAKDMDSVGKPPGEPAYQAWMQKTATGTYRITETVHITTTDPICVMRPHHRCTRDETRNASAAIPTMEKGATSIGGAAYEVDMNKKMITLRTPVPLLPLAMTENIITDEPEGTHSVPTPKGPHQVSKSFVDNNGYHEDALEFTIPLRGDWRRQGGEQTVPIKGELLEGGKLRIRWTFKQ